MMWFKKTNQKDISASARAFSSKTLEERRTVLKQGATRFVDDFGQAIKQLANE